MLRYHLKRQVARFWRGVTQRPAASLVPILCYHSVQPLDRPHCVHPDQFEVQVAYLKANFRLLRLRELVDELCAGRPCGPAAAITLDDGYEDNYTWAFPVLARHNCPATIFLPTAFLEREITLLEEPGFGPLTWEQVRTMRRSGVEFGAHSHTHRILSLLTKGEQKDEILRSKSILENHLGEEIDLFAYPNGQRPDFSTWTVNLLKEADFRGACSTIWGTRNTDEEVFALRRIVVDHDDDLASFSLKVMGAYDYLGILHKMKPRRPFEHRLGGWR